MSAAPIFDGESFQSHLALAFAAQETGIAAHTLYGLVQIQALIAEKNSNHIMQMIAECARDVDHATGTGVALLEEGQLICRGSVGTSTECMQILTAALPLPEHLHSRSELLLIENAEKDSRIESDICRQIGASALLIIPICQGQMLAGVLTVLFAEPHTFPNREVRTYQLIAGLAAESISLQVQQRVEYKEPASKSTVSQAIFRMTSEIHQEIGTHFRAEAEPETETVGPSENSAASVRDWSNWSILRTATSIRHLFKRPFLNKLHWKLEVVSIVIILIVVGGWIAYRQRPFPLSDPAIPRVIPAELQPALPSIINKPPKTQKAGKHHAQKQEFKRKRVRQNEVDYATDVTIRQFGPIPEAMEPRSVKK